MVLYYVPCLLDFDLVVGVERRHQIAYIQISEDQIPFDSKDIFLSPHV
jgi:hypothetical protein